MSSMKVVPSDMVLRFSLVDEARIPVPFATMVGCFYVRRSKSTLRRHHEALAAVSRHLGLTVVPTIQLWLTSWSPMPALQAPQGNERGMAPGSRQPCLLHFTISCNARWSSLLRSSSEVDAAPAPDSRLLSPVHLRCLSAPDDPPCQPLQIV
ncbi:hypothetical protein FB567DRAFT_79915 [Paraphoma chrysanthemicola]|uniref:Uncharacterized protein n=1 Tax=Paraphoma chrysanthemicola TaxID=798071 RepID=A0A8K0R4R1_9PLEO|nr:hypothetical protein FB567DRAFT_79915 [Paraphoma chrysanthemicola]